VLSELDYEVVVMDPASIPVRRHARQRKTDRLDAIALVRLLRRWLLGEVNAYASRSMARQHRGFRNPVCSALW
jgi:transposase